MLAINQRIVKTRNLTTNVYKELYLYTIIMLTKKVNNDIQFLVYDFFLNSI